MLSTSANHHPLTGPCGRQAVSRAVQATPPSLPSLPSAAAATSTRHIGRQSQTTPPVLAVTAGAGETPPSHQAPSNPFHPPAHPSPSRRRRPPHMCTPHEGHIKPIKKAGSCMYLTGSWRESTPYVTNILINIRENESPILTWGVLHLSNQLGFSHNLQIVN